MDRSSRLGAAASVAGSGALLLCALTGLAVSFTSLYPLPVDAPALLPQAVLFALASLCAWSLPRWSGRVCLGLAALWASNVFLNWQRALQGALLVFSLCLQSVAERLGYVPLFHYDPPPGVPGREIALTFLTLALALIALLLGGAVVRAGSWVMALALTLPPVLPALAAGACPHWGGFLALSACWCALLLLSLCRGTAERGWLTLAALAACAALAAGILALFPPEGYTRPQWALDAERAIVDFGDRWLEFLRDWEGPFHDPDSPPPSPAAPVDLSGAEHQSYTGLPVLQVRAGVSGHYYLRGLSLDVYTGSAWESFPDGVWEEYTSALPEDAWTGSPLLFLGCASPFRVYPASVDNMDHGSTMAFLPYQMTDQPWADTGVLPFRDQGFLPAEDAWGFDVSITAYDRDLSALVNWPDAHDGALSPLTGPVARSEEVYRDYVYRHYLDVPDPARETVEGLLTEGPVDGMLVSTDEGGHPWLLQPDTGFLIPAARRPDLAAELIRSLLADRCAYDLDTPAAPEGEDYVTWFLNESRQGYCMHFATAGVLLFRSLGIPARYVSGYTVDLAANAVVSVPDSAAHAWVEIYLDGWGWYPVEVTPGFSDEFSMESVTQDDPSQGEATAPPPEETPSPRPTASPAPSSAPSRVPAATLPPEEPEDAQSWPVWAVLAGAARAAAVLAAAAAALWLIQFCLKSHRRRRLRDRDANRAVLFGYRCLSRMGYWGGKIPPEARALAEKAMYGGSPLTGEERQAMAGLFNGQRQALWMRLYGWRRLAFLYLWGGPDKMKPSQKET